jgi:hypothetical protein
MRGAGRAVAAGPGADRRAIAGTGSGLARARSRRAVPPPRRVTESRCRHHHGQARNTVAVRDSGSTGAAEGHRPLSGAGRSRVGDGHVSGAETSSGQPPARPMETRRPRARGRRSHHGVGGVAGEREVGAALGRKASGRRADGAESTKNISSDAPASALGSNRRRPRRIHEERRPVRPSRSPRPAPAPPPHLFDAGPPPRPSVSTSSRPGWASSKLTLGRLPARSRHPSASSAQDRSPRTRRRGLPPRRSPKAEGSSKRNSSADTSNGAGAARTALNHHSSRPLLVGRATGCPRPQRRLPRHHCRR